MGFTSAGLLNGGRTAHFSVGYDDSLSLQDGLVRASGLLAACEQDFATMAAWFAGVNLLFSYPLPVHITGPWSDGGEGATWTDPPNIVVDFSNPSPTITLHVGSSRSVNDLRYLLVSEVTEMFMASQNRGWFGSTGFVTNANEGSKGEGLSRFLGMQFLLAKELANVPPAGFGVTPIWLNSPRLNYVDHNPNDIQPDAITGCTTLFLYYLHNQLGFAISDIIAAGSSTLAGVYHNLTQQTDGWTSFSNIVNSHYPQQVAGENFSYYPAGDNVFPVPELSAFWSPNKVTCGYSEPTQIFIDRPTTTEVHIQLTSDNPTLLSVPPVVTIPAGSLSAPLSVTAAPIAGPFDPINVNVHASYAGKTLTMTAEIVPPPIELVTLKPNTVVCGENATALLFLARSSRLGPVQVKLISSSPGFATFQGNSSIQVTIPQDSDVSDPIAITTPDIEIPFPTAHATIQATYAQSSASATLTVKPKVNDGILESLTLFPAEVTGGNPSRGKVTLIEAVSKDTEVGLAAVDANEGTLPLPGHGSSIVGITSPVKIYAGQISANLHITTSSLLPSTTRKVRIIAGAVETKYAILTISN